MHSIQIRQTTGKDGVLHLQIPLGKPETEYDVVVVAQPKAPSIPDQTPEDRGWPPGYFEKTFGSIKDETFKRHPQGELPPPAAEFD